MLDISVDIVAKIFWIKGYAGGRGFFNLFPEFFICVFSDK